MLRDRINIQIALLYSWRGLPHKGDPYYISKYEAINGKIDNTSAVTISSVRRFKDKNLELLKINDQLVDSIQDIMRIKIRANKNMEEIKVFLPTKDKAFANLLIEYFQGASINNFNLKENFPAWYETIKNRFSQLEMDEKITKSDLKADLGLSGEGGKKAFQRIQKHPLFHELKGKFSIRKLNNRSFIKAS